MKYRILTGALAVCSLAYSSGAAGQPQPNIPPKTQPWAPLSTLPAVMIRLNNTDRLPADASCLFRHFEVIDERPDTARIGIHTAWPVMGGPRDRQLIFSRSAAGEISGYLDRHFARPGAPYTALVILRTLWLSDANYLREDFIKDPDKSVEKTHIRLKAEIYALRDSLYMPVFRFDTLQYARKLNALAGSSYSNWDRDLAEILNDLADSASLITARKAGRGKKVRLDEIREFNLTRFGAPVNEDTTLKKGVYASFDEFRNNAPSITDFEITMDRRRRLLYLKDGGGAYYSHDAWGYCDGRDIFIMRDGVLCPAWREGRGIYFYSESTKERSRNAAPGSGPSGGYTNPGTGGISPMTGVPVSPLAGEAISAIRGSEYKQRCIYTVDMDTGVFY